MCAGPDANLRRRIVNDIVHSAMHRDDRHLLSSLLLRAKTREEHKSHYEATGTVEFGQELSFQEQTS